MDEDILNSWRSFKLIDEQKTVEVCDQGIPKEISRRERLCLLGLVVSEKSVNKESFKSSMQSLWRLKGRVDFKEVGFDLFIIEFLETLDLKRIKEGRRWSFDRNLICLID